MMFVALCFLTTIFILGEGARHGKHNAAIVFPSLNAVPARSPGERVSFSKATKSIHYAAARLLDLAGDETRLNWVVSPVSLAAVLGQLMLGARGDFHRILGEILSPGKNGSEALTGLELHKELGTLLSLLQDDVWTDYLLYISSALFLHPEIQLKLSYKHALSDIYRVNVFRTNFSGSPDESMNEVNAWVRKATFGRIADILPRPVSPTTASLYVNTVYFKGTWKVPFDPDLTKPGFFSLNMTHQVPVDFMAGEIEVRYLEEPSCEVVGIPYEDSNVFLYIFLPTMDASGTHFKLHEFGKNLTLERMSAMIAAAELQNVTLTLPKLELTSTLSLRDPMVRAINRRKQPIRASNNIRGARDTISEETEDLTTFLSNSYVPKPLPLRVDSGSSQQEKYRLTFNMGSASDDYRFKIDDVLHKVRLEVNEVGTEAVAVSTTLVDYIGGQVVKVNRPFLFLIRHEYTGAHLFWGAIYNPEKNTGR